MEWSAYLLLGLRQVAQDAQRRAAPAGAGELAPGQDPLARRISSLGALAVGRIDYIQDDGALASPRDRDSCAVLGVARVAGASKVAAVGHQNDIPRVVG